MRQRHPRRFLLVPVLTRLAAPVVLAVAAVSAPQSGVPLVPGAKPADPVPARAMRQEPARNPSTGIDAGDRAGGVLLHSGELVLHRRDLAIVGRGLHFRFERTYRSANRRSGPLGHGWDANVFRRLRERADGRVDCHDGTGRVDTYAPLGGGQYASPPGLYTRLRRVGPDFELRERDGTVYTHDAAGALTSVRDRAGNRHDYQYQGGLLSKVVDEFGREIDFGYDGLGRLEAVTDFSGREVRFTHDAAGDLVEARSPLVTGTPHGNDFPGGKRERYQYAGGANRVLAHNLTAVVRPNEVEDASLVPFMTNVYGTSGPFLDRVLLQTVGGTNASGSPAGGTLRYAYDFDPAGGPAGTSTRTRVRDRRGNVTSYLHDDGGHVLRVVEEPGGGAFVTDFEYNADGEVTRRVEPLGGETLYTYDDASPDRFRQGNLLEVRRLPDARGASQTELVTTFTYEPLHNQLASETTARGNDAGYVPQNGGAHSAARYTTTYTYDWQEAAAPPAEATDWGITTPGGLLGLGDVNGDGRTDQALGACIRTAAPTVTLLPGSEQAAVEGDTAQEIVTLRTFDDFGQLIQVEDPRGNVDTYSYFPEEDPDGDGNDLIAGRDAVTGGLRSGSVQDAFVGPNRQDPGPPVAAANSCVLDERGNVLVHTDARGKDTTHLYDALDHVIRIEHPKADPGQAHGYRERFTYDANDNVALTEVENWKPDAGGTQILVGTHPWFEDACVYDILDNPVSETKDATRDPDVPASAEPESLVTEYDYDGNENVVRVHSPRATSGDEPDSVVRFLYDERDLLIAETRGGGSAEESTWTFVYDGNENRTFWIDAEDNDGVGGAESESYTYDGFDRRIRTTDREGNRVERTYDPDGNVVREEAFGPIDGTSVVDALLEGADCLVDELGRTIRIDRDLFLPTGVLPTLPVTITEGALTPGDGKVSERFEYDANDRQTFRVEDDLAVYRFEYDGADRLVREVLPLEDPNGVQTDRVFLYDANGNVVRNTETHSNPEGLHAPATLETIFVYDALDRPVRVTDPLGQTGYSDYDSRDNRVAEHDERGALVADPLGLFAGPINEPGNAVRCAYDGVGRLWLETSELHQDGEGSAPLVGAITILSEYDANGNVVRAVDGGGSTTTYVYDALDRRTSSTRADSGVRSHAYDRDHNVVQTVDENGSVHDMTYDGLDRLVRHDITPDARLIQGTGLPMLVGTTLQTFEYDGLSRLTSSFDDNGPGAADDWTVDTLWDSLSRVIEEDQNGNAVGSSFAADDRTQLVYPNGSRTLGLQYDAHDQLIHVLDPELQIDRAYLGSCSAPFAQASFSLPGPVFALDTQRTLNGNELVVATTLQAGGNPAGQENVQRTRDGRIAHQDLLLQSGGQFLVQQFQFGLSSVDQVLSFDALRDDGVTPTAFSRDIMYGLAQEIEEVLDGAVLIDTRNHDAVYERTDAPFQFNGSNASGTGLCTIDQEHVYQWDGLDRLRVVRDRSNPATVIAEYDYDASPTVSGGRRVRKEVTNSGALDGETRFYHDGLHVIEEDDGAGQVTRQFVLSGLVDDVLAMDVDTNADGDPDQLFFHGKDASSNTTHLVEAGGQVVELYTYDALANPTVFDQAFNPQPFTQAGNPFLFGGRRWEPETELLCFRSRFADPSEGVFLCGGDGGPWAQARNQGNPFVWLGNDPWDQADPAGDGKKPGCKGGILIDDPGAPPPVACPFAGANPPAPDPPRPDVPIGPPIPGIRPDDLGAPPIFSDGFESGDTSSWGAGPRKRNKDERPTLSIHTRPDERQAQVAGNGVSRPAVPTAPCRGLVRVGASITRDFPSPYGAMDGKLLISAVEAQARANAAARCPTNCPPVLVKWLYRKWRNLRGGKKQFSVVGLYRCQP